MQPLGLDEMLGDVLDNVLDLLTRIDKGAILLIDKETRETTKVVMRSKSSIPDNEAWYSQDVVDLVLEEGDAVIISDTDRDDEYNLSDTLRICGIGSVMCVPLTSDSQTTGVIYIDSVNKPYGFRKEDLSLFNSICAPIAMTVENRLRH